MAPLSSLTHPSKAFADSPSFDQDVAQVPQRRLEIGYLTRHAQEHLHLLLYAHQVHQHVRSPPAWTQDRNKVGIITKLRYNSPLVNESDAIIYRAQQQSVPSK